jgi:hypothetical protein
MANFVLAWFDKINSTTYMSNNNNFTYFFGQQFKVYPALVLFDQSNRIDWNLSNHAKTKFAIAFNRYTKVIHQ